MKVVGLVFSLIFAVQVSAANLDSIFHSDAMETLCKEAVQEVAPGRWRTSEPLMAESEESVFVVLREGSTWILREINEGGENKILFKSPEKIYDLAYANGFVWLAKKEALFSYHLETGKVQGPIRSHSEPRTLGKSERIHALYVHGNKLFIAHGTLGVTSLDLNTYQYLNRAPLLTYQDNGHRSKAITLFGNDNDVFVGFDNASAPTRHVRGFNGILHTQFDNMNQFHGAAYDHRRVGILALAWLTYSDGNIVINNMGNLHVISAESVKTKKKIRPSWKPIRTNINGDSLAVYLNGKILIQNSVVYSCAETAFTLPNGKIESRGLLIRHQL